MSGRINLQRMPRNPIAQALSLLAFGVVLIIAILMGAIVLAFVIAFAAVAAVVFWLRMWWLTRKMRRRQSRAGASQRGDSGSEYIEVEYRVVDERDDDGSRKR